MTGVNPTPNRGDSLAQGSKATHIGPETGDTARATSGEDSAAGTHGSGPSPAEGANMGKTADQATSPPSEKRSFEGGGDGIPGTPSQAGAAEDRLSDVSDGD